MVSGVFKGLCPNCGGDISTERLEAGLPCELCLPDPSGPFRREGELTLLHRLEERERAWVEHFERYMGARPWGLQVAWAKRVLLGRSFALLAPTGVGKTSFGISMASFFTKERERTYIIVPTRLLVEQVRERLIDFGLREEELLAFGEDDRQKRERKERLQRGDFSVLITTSMFLYKNYEIIPRDFSFIFVDDVDSFLKTAKNIDKALLLMGFSEGDIERAMTLIRLKERPNKSESDWQRIRELGESVRECAQRAKGVLVVSSATSNPRSSRVKLFRELLGFEVGTPIFYLRNILDTYCDMEGGIDRWIRKLGKGGLVFLPSDWGKESVSEVVTDLRSSGIRAVSYEELDEEVLKDYEEGKIDVIVGIASYRNPLARGFDMPHVVRYAIFYGVPKIVISLKFETNLSHLLWALTSIRPYVAKRLPQDVGRLDRWIGQLRRYQYLTEGYVSERPALAERISSLREELSRYLTSPEVLKMLEESEEITLRKGEDGYYMVVSDATGYLQASGRTSRMYAGGISRGLSVVFVDDPRAFNHLQKKVRWFSDDIKFTFINEVDLQEVLRQIDLDRERMREIRKGRIRVQARELLRPVLIVVESPNKARTIANFFGKAIRRRIGDHELLETSVEDRYLMITASLGHILDLSTEGDGFHGVKVNEHVTPVYEPIEGKQRIIESLKKMAQESSQVLVATDPDTEGEKIGWDIKELLQPFVGDIRRMEFHEVTRKAILKALKEPRDFNENLVKAQIVRRVADRWVGFEFSQLLWQAFGRNVLSAGRVQTPVLGWIIDREAEYRKRIYKVILNLTEDSRRLRIEFAFDERNTAKRFFEELEEIEIEVLSLREGSRNPPPPLRTDTLLKEASDRYRFSLPTTMGLAQGLFELGYITYHRTDSTRVSEAGIGLARDYIAEEFGEQFFIPRSWGEGGAHECIRPTKPIDPEELGSLMLSGQVEGLTRQHLLLYDLIFRRFIASQMRPIIVREADVLIRARGMERKMTLSWDILEEGWNRVLYVELNPRLEGRVYVKDNKELRTQPKAYLYTHGELVQEMKNRGIGRPSTYAAIVEKLLERGYIIDRNGFLIPTRLGKEVYSYLKNHKGVHAFLSEEFTRELEGLMDQVEQAQEDYEKLLKRLYNDIQNVRLHLHGQ
ncbi:MAG: reverse gyrase [Deltaproteobacteria bacterium]|nr:MAG: reverse gyrase [Deltaproteobacteria bacterium]